TARAGRSTPPRTCAAGCSWTSTMSSASPCGWICGSWPSPCLSCWATPARSAEMFWRGVWGYLPANIVQGVVGFLAIIIFTRVLSPDDFGRYALAFSVLTLAHVAVFSWLEAAMARFWASARPGADLAGHFASLYRSAGLLTLAFVPVVLLVLWLWPADPLLKFALAAGLMGCPVRSFVKLAQERYRAAGEVAKAASLDMAVSIGGLAIGVGFALAGAGGAAPLLGLGL